MKQIGIDVGGTFTDGIFLEQSSGNIKIAKVQTTPSNQRDGVMHAIEQSGYNLEEVELFLHGTTVATNAVIEKNGAKVALIVTKGFRDVLKIRRTTRGVLYDLQWDPPNELIERRYRLELDERVDGMGNEIKKVDRDELLALIHAIVADGIEAIAICFINAYANPSHEEQAAAIIKQAYPNLYVTYSSLLLREWREFERMSTVAVAAYVGPLLERYINSLKEEIQRKKYRHEVLLMLSNGGVAPVNTLGKIAPRTLLSGPAAAAIAMQTIARTSGEDSVVSIDIGGTSTDIAITRNGELMMSDEQEIEFGTVVHLPIIDVATIGAGGGTLAWIDRGGMLNMGPHSAGALPGPVCYNLGGTIPTLTDANVLLGRLNQNYLLGGKFRIVAEKSRVAIENCIAKPLQMEVYAAAEGMLEIINQNISNAVRKIMMNRGFDIREFSLFACGGAGPLQAVAVAKNLNMKKVIIPRYPGITAAIGLLMSDVRYDYVESMILPLAEIDGKRLRECYDKMIEQANRELSQAGFAHKDRRIIMYADVRYMAQTHELTLEINSQDLCGDNWAVVMQKFNKLHTDSFGYASALDAPLELVNIRCSAFGRINKGNYDCLFEVAGASDPKPIGERNVFCKERGFTKVPIFDRADLGTGFEYEGPAIIEQIDSTIYVEAGDRFACQKSGNIIISWD